MIPKEARELKTLKDLTLTKWAKEELKAEAIKWVKEYNFIIDNIDRKQTINWIKHFFNITEEDLI